MPYGTDVQIEPGAQSRAAHTVVESDTAVALGTGEVPVLATSRLVAWAEAATLETLRGHVDEGSTTVAMRVNLDHLRPVAVGAEVNVVCTLERIDGRRYIFVASMLDDCNDVVATGRIVRVLVEREPFVDAACGRARTEP